MDFYWSILLKTKKIGHLKVPGKHGSNAVVPNNQKKSVWSCGAHTQKSLTFGCDRGS